MGGAFTCAVSTRIVHYSGHFYANIEKNISMIMKGSHALSLGLGGPAKLGSSNAYRQRRLRRTRSNRILGKPILSAVPI